MRITFHEGSFSGRRKAWYKVCTGVDRKGKGGYAIIGDFIECGKQIDLPLGTVVVGCDPAGSVANPSKVYYWGRCTDSGMEWSDEVRDNRFLDFLDQVEAALAADASDVTAETASSLGLLALLEAVAAGEVSPAEAARRIAAGV